MTLTRSPKRPRSSLPRSNSGRVAAMNLAVCSTESGSFQERISRTASAPVMKKRSAVPWNSRSARSVSSVYVGPRRSISRRDTEKWGLEAVASTVRRYRSSAGVTCRFCHGWPAGTKTTSSSPNCQRASSAHTRCPM